MHTFSTDHFSSYCFTGWISSSFSPLDSTDIASLGAFYWLNDCFTAFWTSIWFEFEEFF